MSNTTGYTLGFAFGYLLSAMALMSVAALAFTYFGVALYAAQIMGAYLVWITISRWEVIVDCYNEGLQRYQ